MRLWSLSPQYLDSKGLVAVWREGLLALNVLREGKGAYYNHPQLERFKNVYNPYPCKNPEYYITAYLYWILIEGELREYKFNRAKLNLTDAWKTAISFGDFTMPITEGQLEYEWKHLQKKLHQRDYNKCRENVIECCSSGLHIKPHPLFRVIKGDVESWERRRIK